MVGSGFSSPECATCKLWHSSACPFWGWLGAGRVAEVPAQNCCEFGLRSSPALYGGGWASTGGRWRLAQSVEKTKGKAALVACGLQEELLHIACTQRAFYGLIKVNGSLPSASARASSRYKNIMHCLDGAFSWALADPCHGPELGLNYHFWFSGGKAETE